MMCEMKVDPNEWEDSSDSDQERLTAQNESKEHFNLIPKQTNS